MTRQHFGQCCLSRSDISGNSDVHNKSIFAYPFGNQKNKHFIILFSKKQIYKKKMKQPKNFVKKLFTTPFRPMIPPSSPTPREVR